MGKRDPRWKVVVTKAVLIQDTEPERDGGAMKTVRLRVKEGDEEME